MIDTYPRFSKLGLEHRAWIREFTAGFDPFSDFNFTSLFCWNIDGATEVSLLNGNLVIKLSDYLDGHPVYSILGRHDMDESVGTLIGLTGKLGMVPEVVVEAIIDKSRYSIVEDRDNFDYVYDLSRLSKMAGGKFKKKRNKTNVFMKAHEDYELVVRTVRELDERHAKAIKDVDRKWVAITPRSGGDILSERKAIDRLLAHFSDLQLLLIEVVVDGDIKGFSINELLDERHALCHFEKALTTHHEHLNTFLTIEVARKLHETGRQTINWEQDLGLEGLRRSKMSYHPEKMLKKYTVSTV